MIKQNALRLTILLISATLCGLVTGLYGQTSGYSCDFEDRGEHGNWRLNEGNYGQFCTNRWCIDTAENNGGRYALYISADGGKSASYVSGEQYVVASRTFTLQAGTYDISFDWQAIGADTVDGLYVCWVPESEEVFSHHQSSVVPAFAQKYGVKYDIINNYEESRLHAQTWNTANTTVTSDGVTPYKLVFLWINYTRTPVPTGACIDNVEIQPATCAKPTYFETSTDPTSFSITWDGQADSYDIRCKTSSDTVWQIRKGVKGNSISIEGMNEGELTFFIRANCGDGHSVWVSYKEFLFYRGLRCIDYFDLTMDNCYIGDVSNPRKNKAVVNFGPASIKSRHTLHYDKTERDARTRNKIRTVPDGEIASVRLGNWGVGGMAEGIDYDFHVDTSEYSVLMLKYAVVLENPPHEPEKQPRFKLEMLKKKGSTYVPFDANACGDADFIAGGSLGWQQVPGENGMIVQFKDWTPVGLNLAEHHGEDIKIRFTTYDCAELAHYGYAYFTLSCNTGKIESLSCGESTKNEFRAPAGFKYRWYKPGSPDVTITTDQVLSVEMDDTATYCCDIIQYTKEECYYTLSMKATARWPIADATYEESIKNCQTVATFTDKSHLLIGKEADKEAAVDSVLWTVTDKADGAVIFTSKERNPEIVFPDLGGKFDVTLTSYLSACSDEKVFPFDIPASDTERDTIYEHICEGDPGVMFGGVVRNQPGFYSDTTGTTATGCPRIETLSLSVQYVDSAYTSDTVCSDELPIDFYGQQISATGIYRHMEKNIYGCDSMNHVLNLLVNESLNLTLAPAVDVCADNLAIEIPFDVTSGLVTTFDLTFEDKDADGKMGVKDGKVQDSKIVVELPEGTEPDSYPANLVFKSMDCANKSFDIEVNVLYPDSIIVQRWNDVLGIRNAKWNGGYDFVAFQWYKDGQPIEGQSSANLYLPDGLDFSGSYHARITRSDGTSANTCPVTPTEYPADAIEVVPTVTFKGGSFSVKSSVAGVVRLWTATGVPVMSADIADGITDVKAPVADGAYIMEFIMADGRREVRKVIVRGDIR